jgi:hypothetical protein
MTLAVATAAVGLYCLGCLVLRLPHLEDHPRDVVAWHVVMAVGMVVMLVASTGRAYAWGALAAFVVGILWALARLARRPARAAYLRLGVGCAAMVAMLLPAAAPATAAAGSAQVAGQAHHAHLVGTGAVTGGGDPGTAPPAFVLVALLMALALAVAHGVVRAVRAPERLRSRLDTGCDVVMATVMGTMLWLML